MKYLLLISAALVIIFYESCKSGCTKFQEGAFRDVNKRTGTTFITRKGNIQTERNHDIGYSAKLSVKWIDDCKYTMKLLEVTENRPNMPFDTSLLFTVEIVQVKENSYLQRTSSNNSTKVYESEIMVDK